MVSRLLLPGICLPNVCIVWHKIHLRLLKDGRLHRSQHDAFAQVFWADQAWRLRLHLARGLVLFKCFHAEASHNVNWRRAQIVCIANAPSIKAVSNGFPRNKQHRMESAQMSMVGVASQRCGSNEQLGAMLCVTSILKSATSLKRARATALCPVS